MPSAHNGNPTRTPVDYGSSAVLPMEKINVLKKLRKCIEFRGFLQEKCMTYVF